MIGAGGQRRSGSTVGAGSGRICAAGLLEALLDPGTFRSWDRPPLEVRTSERYRDELRAAAERAGTDESVRTGEGLLRGRRVAVIACEFGFLAGSIGVAAAERIVTAVERATELGLPLIASPTSGGTRMQEGTVAFVQMVKIAGAVAAHKSAGYPYLVYLRDPTMGGVFASWGSLGHMTFAQPGAMIGFLGPRVYQALYDQPFPSGVQTAENLYRHGVIDGVVGLSVFRRIAHRALSVLSGVPDPDAATPVSESRVPDLSSRGAASMPGERAAGDIGRASGGAGRASNPAWQSVLSSRRPDRPGLRELLRHVTQRVPLSGTGQGETDRTVVLALARFRGHPCVVFGHDRAGQVGENTMGPAALREARRSMQLAQELRVPLVLVIDTVGAALSKEAEERGLAPEIARCIADLVTLDTPTISVLLGQGTGGGALALLPADRVLAATHGWLAPLPPEGASAIVHRDTEHAPELARSQGIRAADLRSAGIVDRIVAEKPDAADEPIEFARRMVAAIGSELAGLRATPLEELRAARHLRYRRLGLPHTG
ncbi:acetyl-coenzyme A carboxylase carboxyl transferase subunits beta/alpha [Nocardia cyriacigeorgica]|uniref:acetyl-coenzyme A carboxylase carboxyl transferase subunits beta/alpha n=1 Tax=Nocardia cyriacigeorgica TaxID=135487 RepID=UPI0002F39E68|nr:carboxyl transferase domain-containing protein [Nocardia cyriacigeorgica]AVH20914.1 acetyl-CoA carboxyl transferase [Nocardia cyriacigeorgica]PPJ08185.1 acetyl-CoA carboxyl transferase [Nocardia cyriacigeorgica]TLF54638.1 acetyl-CoA carboxyl transferase [Nocardia cyriacigeorgica]